jgi:hypothetical protein
MDSDVHSDFPGGKRFAFTVIDDTDVATVDNVRPVYDLLHSLGMRTTKTVWPVSCPEGSPNYSTSETLEDVHYLEFVRDLARKGFEITWHCATMESSERERTVRGLERFHQCFGHFPRVHANHSFNRENLYWGGGRFDNPLLRLVFGPMSKLSRGHFQGHREGSPYWWGDLAHEHIVYGRNLTFEEINLRRINPSMPYQDPRRPLVRWWFSATDAEDVEAFNRMLRPDNIDRLEQERGICIVATHFGKRFVTDGAVNAGTRAALENLGRRPGWFPPVGELLDWMRSRRSTPALPAREWRRMQWRWATDLVRRKMNERKRKTSP